VNDLIARQVIDGVLAGEGSPAEVVAARGLAVVSDDSALSDAVARAIAANPDAAAKLREGRQQAIGALMGAVMRDLGGKADAGRVRELILEQVG
jgi:aspartyl-tRNA(Asn)/glutamyl-tRNA(Gln) amidotransferase subunit B